MTQKNFQKCEKCNKDSKVVNKYKTVLHVYQNHINLLKEDWKDIRDLAEKCFPIRAYKGVDVNGKTVLLMEFKADKRTDFKNNAGANGDSQSKMECGKCQKTLSIHSVDDALAHVCTFKHFCDLKETTRELFAELFVECFPQLEASDYINRWLKEAKIIHYKNLADNDAKKTSLTEHFIQKTKPDSDRTKLGFLIGYDGVDALLGSDGLTKLEMAIKGIYEVTKANINSDSVAFIAVCRFHEQKYFICDLLQLLQLILASQGPNRIVTGDCSEMNLKQIRAFSMKAAKELFENVFRLTLCRRVKTSNETVTKSKLQAITSWITKRMTEINDLNFLLECILFQNYDEHSKKYNFLSILTTGSTEMFDGLQIKKIKEIINRVQVISLTELKQEGQTLHIPKSKAEDTVCPVLFDMASSVSNSDPIMRSLFDEAQISYQDGESKLYVQVSKSAALSLVCGRIFSSNAEGAFNEFRDSCINLRAMDQNYQHTCYAYAAAYAMYFAEKRIYGRQGPHIEIKQLIDKMIKRCPKGPPEMLQFLQRCCPKYRFMAEEIDEKSARKAISDRRPVVATFGLTEKQKKMFDDLKFLDLEYFRENESKKETNKERKKKTKKERKKEKREEEKKSRHAVLLVNDYSNHLVFLNSYGEEWGKNGFFRVEKSSIEAYDFRFYDVSWKVSYLTEREKAVYKRDWKGSGKRRRPHLRKFGNSKTVRYVCPNPDCKKALSLQNDTHVYKAISCSQCGSNVIPLLANFIFYP